MSIIVLVIDDNALTRVQEAAAAQNEKFDVLLSEQFSEFLYAKQFSDTPPVVKKNGANGAQPADARDEIIAKLIEAGSVLRSPFVFNTLVPLVPELAAMSKQEQTTLASLFARRYDEGGLLEKLPKVGKNATQYQSLVSSKTDQEDE